MADEGTPVRIPSDLLDETERLLNRMMEVNAPELALGRKTRGIVLRYALALGIQELWRRYGQPSQENAAEP